MCSMVRNQTRAPVPGEGALDDPAVAAKPGAVPGLAAGDHGLTPRAQTSRRYLSWS
jgi:hypothetical protein